MLRLAMPHKRPGFYRQAVSLRIGQNVMNEERPTHGSTSETEATLSAEK